MDLRVKKTLISIKEAFYTLRKRKSVEKITVKELSETALINKATFYLHYKDIFDLTESLQENLIDKIIQDVLKCGLENTEESYKIFTDRFITCISENKDDIDILFKKNSTDFITRMETKLKSVIFKMLPQYKEDAEKDVLLSYIIYGSYNATLKEYNCSEKQLRDYISKFSLMLMLN